MDKICSNKNKKKLVEVELSLSLLFCDNKQIHSTTESSNTL